MELYSLISGLFCSYIRCFFPSVLLFLRIESDCFRMVLPEIKELFRLYFLSYCLFEILITDYAISIMIESFINLVEFFRIYVKSPIFEGNQKFILLNEPRFFSINFGKGSFNRFPLLGDLFNHYSHQILLLKFFISSVSCCIARFFCLLHRE